MNKKQKICLWVGLAVLDLILIPSFVACIRHEHEMSGWATPIGHHYSWTTSSVLIAIFFVIINTGVVFVVLKDKKTNEETNHK